MNIDKVTFQTTYNIAPFLNIKVGFEASPSEASYDTNGKLQRDADTAEVVLSVLKKMADDWCKSEYPHLNQDEPKDPEYAQNLGKKLYQEMAHNGQIPTISKDSERLEIAIDNATSLEELAVIKESCGKLGLMKQYVKRVNQLMDLGPKPFTDGF